ncbi:MAG: FtsH protease activity modulator HflK, partial [Planctomycetes bacterium]|nr:FtsH protease activity modulator HflK [Planctomycetota bacterium]
MADYYEMEFGRTRTPLTRALDVGGLVAVGLFALWAAPGSMYVLDGQRGQQAVIQRFGAYARTESKPGIHLKWPWPIEYATVLSTTEVRRLEIGFQSKPGHPGAYADEAHHSVTVTKDQSLVNAEFALQYAVADPKAYLFNVADADRTIEQLAKAAMRSAVASRGVDEILLGDRATMQAEVLRVIQDGLNDYGAGLKVTAVQFQNVHAPKEVEDAFSDVARAVEDQETATSEGRKAYNAKVPVAEGQARVILANAEAYRIQRINEAKGDAKRFLSLLEQYREDPEFTRRQLHLHALQEVLPQVGKWVVEKGVPVWLGATGDARPAPPSPTG